MFETRFDFRAIICPFQSINKLTKLWSGIDHAHLVNEKLSYTSQPLMESRKIRNVRISMGIDH